MILIIFGTGVVCQTVLGSNPAVSPTPKGVSLPTEDLNYISLIFTQAFLSLNFGWAAGILVLL